MSYQENYQKWVDFVELPDYLRQDLENMDEKLRKMPSIQILNLVLQVCVAWLVLVQTVSTSTLFAKLLKDWLV